jgi:hypothetical protein
MTQKITLAGQESGECRLITLHLSIADADLDLLGAFDISSLRFTIAAQIII